MKNKLEMKNNLKLGLKLAVVSAIPGIITILVMSLFNFQAEPMTLKDGIVFGFSILLQLYLYGFFVNKWKKWIFK